MEQGGENVSPAEDAAMRVLVNNHESCLRHSKFVKQDEQDHVWIWFGLC